MINLSLWNKRGNKLITFKNLNHDKITNRTYTNGSSLFSNLSYPFLNTCKEVVLVRFSDLHFLIIQTNKMKQSNFGILLISFLFPIIGIFIWLAYMDHPRGKDAGKTALVSICIGIFFLMLARSANAQVKGAYLDNNQMVTFSWIQDHEPARTYVRGANITGISQVETHYPVWAQTDIEKVKGGYRVTVYNIYFQSRIAMPIESFAKRGRRIRNTDQVKAVRNFFIGYFASLLQ